ncbi:MAG: hypothetical protein IPK13_05260 [Deltaproteobacteria bacterium]|nr:hypothetical protein [Deltaproteobacteria bacterium]
MPLQQDDVDASLDASSPADGYSSDDVDIDVDVDADASRAADGASAGLDSEVADLGLDAGTGSTDAGSQGPPIEWPDESQPPPPLNPNEPYDFVDATRFLYEGDNPIQQGVFAEVIVQERVSVIRGRVADGSGNPLVGAAVRVVGHPEFGHSRTKRDGIFELAVNGGGRLTIEITKDGYLPAHRPTDTQWNRWHWVEDAILTALDAKVTEVDLSTMAAPVLVSGTEQTDVDGSRTARALFTPRTTAELIMPDGSRVALSTLHVRATEYTVGENGLAKMPAPLPSTTVYTYAVELSVDEAIDAGAVSVQFGAPVPVYVDNFLNASVGETVPVGFYNRQRAMWEASENGVVIGVLSSGSGPTLIDVAGDGHAATVEELSAIGITQEELSMIGLTYPTGTSFWRAAVPHFSAVDLNFRGGPNCDDEDCAPPAPNPEQPPEDECEASGSTIYCESQALGEDIPIAGTPYRIHYSSDRVPGARWAREISIPVSGASVPQNLVRIESRVYIEGKEYLQYFPPIAGQSHTVTWGGLDSFGRPLPSGSSPHVFASLSYVFPVVYSESGADVARAFAERGGGARLGLSRSAGEFVLVREAEFRPLAIFDARTEAMGGWTLDAHHQRAYRSDQIHLGYGGRTSYVQTSNAYRLNRLPLSNLQAVQPSTSQVWGTRPLRVSPRSDGSLLVVMAESYIFSVHPDGRIEHLAGSGAGVSGCADYVPIEGGDAKAAMLSGLVTQVIEGRDGLVYFSIDYIGRVYRIELDGTLTHIAGSGTACMSNNTFSGPGLAQEVELGNIQHLTQGDDGTLYVGDKCKVLAISSDGYVRPFLGVASQRDPSCSEGMPVIRALGSQFDHYELISVLALGDRLYVSDLGTIHGPGWGPRQEATISVVHSVDAQGTVRGEFGVNAQPDVERADGAVALDAWARAVELFRGPKPQTVYLNTYVTEGLGNIASFEIDARGILRQVTRKLSSWDIIPGFTPGWGFLSSSDDNELVGTLGPLLVDEPTWKYVFDDRFRHVRTLDPWSGLTKRSFTFDDKNRLSEVIDSLGRATSLQYTPTNEAVSIVAPGGERTVLSLNGDGYLEAVTSPGGGVYRMQYTSDGLLTAFQRPDGGRSTFEYDAAGRLIADTNARGERTQLSRHEDGSRRSVTIARHDGSTEIYRKGSGSSFDEERSITHADGTITEFRSATRLSDGISEVIHPNGVTEQIIFAPDPRFGMTESYPARIEIGDPETQRNRVITVERTVKYEVPEDATSALKQQTGVVTIEGEGFTTTYDAPTRETSIRDNRTGLTRVSVADEKGEIIAARLVSGTTHEIREKRFEYTETGLLSRVDGPRTDVADTIDITYGNQDRVERVTLPHGYTISIEAYDAEGRPTHVMGPNGEDTRITYDAAGTVREVNNNGRIATWSSDPSTGHMRAVRPGGAEYLITATNSANRKATIESSTGDTAVFEVDVRTNTFAKQLVDGEGVVRGESDWALDPLHPSFSGGNAQSPLSVEVDPILRLPRRIQRGRAVVTLSYDHAGRVLEKVSGSGATESFTHRADGYDVTDASGLVTHVGRNGFGELALYEPSYAGTTSYEYGESGRIVRRTDGRGLRTSYTYDAHDRLRSVDYESDDNEDALFRYDERENGIGRLTSTSKANSSTEFDYSIFGEIIEQRETIYGTALRAQHRYSSDGAVTETVYPSGLVVRYTLDGMMRIVRIDAELPGSPATTVLDSASYLPFGPLAGYALPGGRHHIREYSSTYRLRRMATDDIVDWTYVYRDEGVISEISEGRSGTRMSFDYDADLRLTNASGPFGVMQFESDAGSNRVRSVKDGVEEIYGYDATTGRLESVSGVGREYRYDGAGNVVSDAVHSFEHGSSGNLLEVTGPFGVASYLFSVRGARVAKTVNQQRTLYFTDHRERLLGEYQEDGQPIQEVVWMGSTPVAVFEYMDGGARLYWVTSDHLGTPRYLHDIDGNITWSWESDPFGVLPANEDPDGDGHAVKFNLRFPGHYADVETGLFHNRYRSYDPATGRYLEPDPLGVRATLSVYTYAFGNPVTWIDAMGLQETGPLPGWGAFDAGNGMKGFNFLDTPGLNLDHASVEAALKQAGVDGPVCIVCAHGTEDAAGFVDGKDIALGNLENGKPVKNYKQFIAQLIAEGVLGKDDAIFLFSCGAGRSRGACEKNAAQKVADAMAENGSRRPIVVANPAAIDYVNNEAGFTPRPDPDDFFGREEPAKFRKFVGKLCEGAGKALSALGVVGDIATTYEIVEGAKQYECQNGGTCSPEAFANACEEAARDPKVPFPPWCS